MSLGVRMVGISLCSGQVFWSWELAVLVYFFLSLSKKGEYGYRAVDLDGSEDGYYKDV